MAGEGCAVWVGGWPGRVRRWEDGMREGKGGERCGAARPRHDATWRGVLIWAVCVGTAAEARAVARTPPDGAQHLLRLLHAADTSLASEA
jgi:hypothetical protein